MNKKEFRKLVTIAGLKILLVILTTVTLGIPKLTTWISNKINDIQNQDKE